MHVIKMNQYVHLGMPLKVMAMLAQQLENLKVAPNHQTRL